VNKRNTNTLYHPFYFALQQSGWEHKTEQRIDKHWMNQPLTRKHPGDPNQLAVTSIFPHPSQSIHYTYNIMDVWHCND
jgi:hypothetical protein